MRGILAALGIVVVLSLAALPAQAQNAPTCPVVRLAPPIVRFKVIEPKIVYHHDLDLVGLAQMHAERHSERPPKGSVTLGVTINPTYLALHGGSMQTATASNGRTCAWIGEVDAESGDKQMDVYIARNYAVGSCEYNNILEHENTHVRFNLEVLRAWAPTLQASLNEAAARRFPIISADASEEAGRILFSAMRTIFRLMGDDFAKRNAVIDTPENYRLEQAKCKNWFPPGIALPR